MGRCKSCKKNPCSCSSSSNSSSSSISSSIPHDLYRSESTSDCARPHGLERLNNCKSKEYRTVSAYNVDTYNISYRKRILEVPSREYPTLDDAMRSLQLNAGGYVIKLMRDTEHELNGTSCYQVDDLIIEGDCDKFSGKCYAQRCFWDERRPRPVSKYPVCEYLQDRAVGNSSWTVRAYGSKITVSAVNHMGEPDPHNDPCFDDINCRNVVLFGPRGEMICTTANGRGNSISVGATPPFIDVPSLPVDNNGFQPYIPRCGAYGFYFPPNVRIKSNIEDIQITTTNSLRIVGCQLDMANLFSINALNGTTVLSGCVITRALAFTQGRVTCPDSNVWTSVCYVGPGVTGQFYNQFVIGINGHVTCDGAQMAWYYGIYAGNLHGCDATNGGTLSLLGSEFSNNCTAVTANFGSTISIPDCRFCCNYYCLLATYNSNITSQPISIPGYDLTRVFQAPWFINSVTLVVAFMQSMVVVPNLQQRHNLIAAIVDGCVHTTFESIPIDMIGQRGSTFSYIPSSLTPEGLGCRTIVSQPGSEIPLPLTRLLDANAWTVVSGAFVESIVGRTGQGTKAAVTVERLASDIASGQITHIPACIGIRNPDYYRADR